MSDYAKRPEVTVSTMGKVHNPTGQGVRAVSSQAQAKAAKVAANGLHGSNNNNGSAHAPPPAQTIVVTDNHNHETKTKEGTARRNITRKKTADKDSGNYNSAYKKQGGHGKGEWKEIMDPSNYAMDAAGSMPIDEDDPLFVPAEDDTADRYILSSGDNTHTRGRDDAGIVIDPTSGTSKAVYGPLLTLPEFKFQLAECLKEYFDSADTDEVVRTLAELKCAEFHQQIAKKAISLALDKGPRERELISRLLTCLHPTPLSMQDMEASFVALLDSLDELCKDVPDANTMVASFLARAVVDEVLPPAFLSEQNNDRPGNAVVEKAVQLLSREHCTARLERVWGPGDGRPVAELKVEMDQLLLEYLSSRELDEAARCVKELDCAHFHHELVKRGAKAAMEQDGRAADANGDGGGGGDAALANVDAMSALFGFLVRNAIVSEYQVAKGVSRLHQILPDITLDVPSAPKLLEAFEKMITEQGCLPTNGSSSPATTATNGENGREAAKQS